MIPEGFWVLDQAKSVELQPGAQTLWIVKDDGRTLVWVSILRDDRNRVRVMSYDGHYNGDAAPIVGGPMRGKISSPGPGKLHNEGEIAGVGPYIEDCSVLSAGKVLACDGEVSAPSGVQRWHDHFEYAGLPPSR